MTQETFKAMLTHACGKPASGGEYRMGQATHGAVLLSTGGAMVTVDHVNAVVLNGGFAQITTQKGDRYLLDSDQIIGLKLTRVQGEGAGFLNR